MKKYKNIFFILMTMFAILAQLVNPTLVYADGETPLPPTEIATEAAPTETPSVTDLPTQPDTLGTEATPTELPTATEVPASASPTIDPVATDIPAADTAPPEEPTLLEIMEQIPAQTDIVVLDETGQAVPLATQEAAGIILIGDPFWCPTGSEPYWSGCTTSYPSLKDLLDYLSAQNGGKGIDADGTIWIEDTYISSINDSLASAFMLDGSVLTSWADNTLTIRGGFTHYAGDSGGDNPITGQSDFSVPISIYNWTGAVTVNNITVNGAAGTGLTVNTAGNININNVTVTNAGGYGAYLNNTASVSAATVTIGGTNTFSGNYYAGLYVLSDGNISANNITASNSTTGSGTLINNTTSSSNATVTLTGTNIFSGNTYTGLYVQSDGNISANNITASNSTAGYGTYIDNTTSSSNATIELTGTNTFNGNRYNSLSVFSNGNISANNITASNSTVGYGTYINNTTSSSNATVTITGTNMFSGNNNTGLYVLSNGNISIANVTAGNNSKDGAYLKTIGNVTIANSSFSGNQNAPYSGLAVFNSANATITNSTFSGNGYGAYLSGITNATLSDNTFTGNKRDGAFISALGNVAITNNSFNGNNINPYSGLAVFNAAAINATNNTFSGNYYGLYLYNVRSVSAIDNLFTGNRKYGLAVTNGDSVSLSNNNVTYNCAGVYLNTSAATTINDGSISNNVSGIVKINDASLLSLNGVIISDNINDRTNMAIECETAPTPDPDSDPAPTPTPASIGVIIDISNSDEGNGLPAEAEFEIDCIHQQRYIVNLPNDDQVQVVCPVSGKARISRLDNTTLPADLPAGYTYASAFSLDIIRGEKPISVIDENGYIKVSFNIPSLEAGTTYSVLYWDNGTWTPLKDFMIDENGNPRGFSLHANDPRRILSGSNFIFEEGSPTRLEISTNFPGIFVLAQH